MNRWGAHPRIVDVRPIVLRAPLERPVRTAFGTMHTRNGVLVEVAVEGGLTGLGESWVNYPSWAPAERVATIVEGLRPLVLGELADDPRRIWQHCMGKLRLLALQWGAPGPIYQALSGLDIALWDLAGRAQGAPIWQLLGAPRQASVRAYASGLGPERPDEQAAAIADGFEAVKLKLGFGAERDEANLRAVRAAIGARTLFTDANQGWSAAEAVAMLPALTAAGAAWLEEPLAVDDEEGWRQLHAAAPLPLAGGENLYGGQFARWLASGLLGVAQPDVCKCGGITAARDALQRATERGLRLAPHYFGGAVGLAATIHLFAALPPGQRVLVEYDINANPLREELLSDPLYLGGGALHVPDGPGLGVELRPAALTKYAVG